MGAKEPPVIDKELLDILACPETHQPLAMAGDDVLAAINQRIEAGTCTDVGGEKVDRALDGGLVREDGKVVYAIRDSIPVLLIDKGISAE